MQVSQHRGKRFEERSMFKRALLLLFPTLFTGHAMANTVEFCPDPKEIKVIAGFVLRADTQSGNGEWIKVLQRDRGVSVIGFERGVFRPSKDDAKVGHLESCTFLTTGMEVADLAFRPEVNPKVSLAYPPAWKEKQDAKGTYFECTSKDLQGCAFREVK